MRGCQAECSNILRGTRQVLMQWNKHACIFYLIPTKLELRTLLIINIKTRKTITWNSMLYWGDFSDSLLDLTSLWEGGGYLLKDWSMRMPQKDIDFDNMQFNRRRLRVSAKQWYWGGSFEYIQLILWLKSNKNIYQTLLIVNRCLDVVEVMFMFI